MNICRDWNELPVEFGPTALAMGNFDGVHLGHRAVLANVVKTAREHRLTACVLTFDPHPVMLLHPERAPAMLQTLQDRVRALALTGLDCLLLAPFTQELAAVPAGDFIEHYLLRRLRCADLFVGHDATFGRERAGTLRTLQAAAAQGLFRLHITQPVMHGGERVSSSRIRRLLEAGEVDRAAVLLGRPFVLEGPVVRGAGRGQVLGFPTANLAPEGTLVPGSGVYACRAETAMGTFAASVHLGPIPTFARESPTVEAHLLDFDHDLRNQRIRLYFVERLRDIRIFADSDALARQIVEDVALTRRALATRMGA